VNHAGGGWVGEHAEVLVWNSPSKPEVIPCFGNLLGMGQTPLRHLAQDVARLMRGSVGSGWQRKTDAGCSGPHRASTTEHLDRGQASAHGGSPRLASSSFYVSRRLAGPLPGHRESSSAWPVKGALGLKNALISALQRADSIDLLRADPTAIPT